MLHVVSALKGYAIEATDGTIGTVADFLIDDRTWAVRWLVVDSGGWLSHRRVLIHPTAIGAVDDSGRLVAVALTKAQVASSPDIAQDRPVSQQMEESLFDHYGWDPMWGGASYFGGMGMGYPMAALPFGDAPYRIGGAVADLAPAPGDTHLRSLAAVRGYHVHASDGDIGHVADFLIEDAPWGVRYLILDTRNWWPGQHVLMSPYAVRDISWAEHDITLDVTRDKVKTSPPWDPAAILDEIYEQRVHTHYDWPGYGW
jgi:hypothetical protein